MNPIVKLFLGANVFLFRATGGKIGSSMFGGRVLLLTTKGSKSEKIHRAVMYFDDYAMRSSSRPRGEVRTSHLV